MHCNKKDLMYPSVKFQRASHNLESFTATRSGDVSEKFENENRNFSGSEAREFYENLLKESFDTSSHNEKQHNSENTYSKVRKLNKNKPRINSEKKSVSHDTRQKNLFLKMAQDGDSDGLQRIIRDNKVDINVRDQFGWTALMCAAKSGHKSCIMLLIKEGADVNLKNSQGQTAKDISQQSGLQDLFMFHRRSTRKRKSKIHSELTSDVEQTCQVCKIKFVGPRQEHDTSTAHLFNCQYKSERTLYHIPEDNIGFKIMKQRGWDQEKGWIIEGLYRTEEDIDLTDC